MINILTTYNAHLYLYTVYNTRQVTKTIMVIKEITFIFVSLFIIDIA